MSCFGIHREYCCIIILYYCRVLLIGTFCLLLKERKWIEEPGKNAPEDKFKETC